MPIRFLNIILALLIFISSSGFTLHRHYCQSELQGMSILVKPENCHSKAARKADIPPCHQKKSCHAPDEEKKCCDEKSDFIKLEQDQPTVELNVKGLQQPILIATLLVILNLNLPPAHHQSVEYLNYKPPLIVCDYFPLLQTFLL